MDLGLGPLFRILEGTGPVGAYIAAGLVGLSLVLIVFAKTQGLFNDTRTAKQQVDFQKMLLDQLDRLTKREEALRVEMAEVQTHVVLMRNQLRKAIDLLRQVREGHVSPDAIDTDAIEEAR